VSPNSTTYSKGFPIAVNRNASTRYGRQQIDHSGLIKHSPNELYINLSLSKTPIEKEFLEENPSPISHVASKTNFGKTITALELEP